MTQQLSQDLIAPHLWGEHPSSLVAAICQFDSQDQDARITCAVLLTMAASVNTMRILLDPPAVQQLMLLDVHEPPEHPYPAAWPSQGTIYYWTGAPARESECSGLIAQRRRAAAILVSFPIRKRLMTRLRSPAIIWGAEPVLIWQRSSSMVTSRTQNTRFSIPRCPRHSSGNRRGSACCGERLVTA